jgi:eukaryotic-like serine/threonine-protein kinase
MPLERGSRVGRFEILSAIGAGGMGEVYRARDSRLQRDVAIKILPELVADDVERRERFDREAQVLASLNHPNIAAIHGFEESDGAGAIVMELVDGETLADRLARGKLPVSATIAIAQQIASALDAAHERGIVHRDLKPANIKLTAEGTVKVLDFGLAKAMSGTREPASDLAESPTVYDGATRAGIILGTAPYMSPEQARGERIDARTDVWAFGCVLYEMLTGRRTFSASTTADTIAAILQREPDWSAIPQGTPSALRRLLSRCLEKDPRRRLRSVGDGRLDLEEALSGNAVESPALARSQPWLLIAAATLITTGLTWAALGLFRGPSGSSVPQFPSAVRLTSGPDREVAPAISPDGKWVAYVSDAGGRPNVWVKFRAAGDAMNITASSGLDISSGTGVGGLDISPDGTRIAVMARVRDSEAPFATWELPAPFPGVPRKVLGENFLAMRWSPDGRQIAFINAGAASGDALYVADADGSNRRQLIARHDGMHIHWPAWSTDGYIYFLRTFSTISNLDQSEIYRIAADGSRAMEPVVETPRRAAFPLPLANGRGLIYSANPGTAELGLWWTSADRKTTRPLTTGVGDYAEPRTSGDGDLLVCTWYVQNQALMKLAAVPGRADAVALTDGNHGDLDPTLSFVGDRVAFSSSRDGNRHIWTARLDGSDARPITSGASQDDRPAYSPDGRQIAFESDRGGRRSIWVVPADGGAPRKIVDAVVEGGLTWSRDSRVIVYSAGGGSGPVLWKMPVAGGAPERIPTPHSASEPAWSPVEDIIAYMSTKRVDDVSYTSVAFIDPAGKEVRAELPGPPRGNRFANGLVAWSPDGRRLAVTQQQANTAARIWLVDPAAANPYTALMMLPHGPRIRGLTWTRDGKSLIFGKHDWTSDVVLLDQGK